MEPFVEAVVQVGPSETRYRRAGQGRTVLLLVEPGQGSRLSDALLRGLARDFRVFAPVITPDLLDAAKAKTASGMFRWLEGVMDGLGLERAVVVASPRIAALLRPWLRDGSDWIERVVEVRPGVQRVETPATGTPSPVLRLDIAEAVPSGAELARLVRFLERN